MSLQEALAAEHAAVYVLGALAAQTSATAQPELYAQLSTAYEAHREQRDRLVGAIAATGEEPTPAAPAYDLPARLDTPETIEASARDVEGACAEAYAYAVATSTGEERRSAAQALNDAAVRVLGFRGSPEIFPGAVEYPDR